MSLRSTLALSCAALLAFSPLFAAGGELVYRGRIVRADGRPFDGLTRHTARFTVRGTRADEVWRAETSILPSKEGHYQVLLSDTMEGVSPGNTKTLSWLLEEGGASTIAVSIDGDPEFYPEQRILPVPLSDRAKRADGLAAVATAGTVKTDRVVAGSISLENADITEAVEIAEKDASLSIDEWKLDGSGRIEGASTFLFFRQKSSANVPFRGEARNIDSRTELVGPPASDAALRLEDFRHGGVLVLVSEDNWTLPAVSLLVPGGEFPFRCPVECSGRVSLYFYPFGK